MSYSFNLKEYIEEGEISLSITQGQASMSDTTKNRLSELLQLLDKDIANLVQDAEPIRQVLSGIKEELPLNLLEALSSIANIKDQALPGININDTRKIP